MQSIASSNRSTYYPRIIHNLARENSIKNVFNNVEVHILLLYLVPDYILLLLAIS